LGPTNFRLRLFHPALECDRAAGHVGAVVLEPLGHARWIPDRRPVRGRGHAVRPGRGAGSGAALARPMAARQRPAQLLIAGKARHAAPRQEPWASFTVAAVAQATSI